MKLGFHLAQKQTLKLVMTPRLQQALKLLQMPALELSAHIKEELLTNPLLEVDEDSEESQANSDAQAQALETAQAESTVSPDESLFKSEDNINWGDYFRDGYEYNDEPTWGEHEETEFVERTPVGRTTLTESLSNQLHLMELDEETLRVAEYLLGCLDDNGFVAVPFEEIIDTLAVSMEVVEKALKAIQSLDPPGIGARNLPESLLIQLRDEEKEGTLPYLIVEQHFEALKQKQYQDIARALKVTPADVQDAAREIGTLNPRPGAALALEDARYVVPDLLVEKVDGRYEVSLNEGSVPRLKVSKSYRELLTKNGPPPRKSEPAQPSADGAGNSGDAASNNEAAPKKEGPQSEVEFIQERLKSANWLIQTIEQRRRTMIKVMESIVEAQMEFFEKGPQALRPLTLQDVAEKIGMHESTVSRVTTNKYVQTPRGVFPLKYFFSSGLDTESGDAVSSKMAMNRIKELVEKEERKHPLSDQKIVELLRKEGLIVARRTVAKYREKMGILSARYRKEF
ncbi:MAG TPA: RNA polymerase factor sigma-54 [bacterium]|nr:RNA polymerase factor sigma-54 [bacterium]